MSTEFQTLKECIEAKKGAFIGVIIKQGDLKSGTSNKGTEDEKDWTYKKFTISGEDGIEIVLTAWNGDIEKFKVGNKYEFVGLWFKEYQDSPVLDIGKFGKVNLIGTATIPAPPGQTTIPEPTKEEQVTKVMNENTPAHEQAHPPATPIPEIGGAFAAFIETECITLLQIEKIVKETMKTFEPDKIQDGGKIGMHTKEIYRESKKSKFEKASES